MSAAGISSVVSSEVGSHGTVVRLVEQASPSNDTRRLVGLVELSLRQWGHWKNALVTMPGCSANKDHHCRASLLALHN